MAPYRKEQNELRKSEGVLSGAMLPEEKRKRWQELEDLVTEMWKKYDMDRVCDICERVQPIENKIKDIEERLASSS